MTVVRVGDDLTEYNDNFKLFLVTSMANPHYTPEVATKVVLINFTITPTGLDDQMLAIVVEKERSDLEQQRNNLIVSNARYEAELKAIEEEHRRWRLDYKQRHSGEVKQLTQLLSQSYQQIKDPVTSENLRAVAKISSEIVELTKKASGSPFRNTQPTKQLRS